MTVQVSVVKVSEAYLHATTSVLYVCMCVYMYACVCMYVWVHILVTGMWQMRVYLEAKMDILM